MRKSPGDAEYIYFYVETASAMTSPQDENWMMLFIDIDRNKSTGWEGYDYVVQLRNAGRIDRNRLEKRRRQMRMG